MREHNLGAKEPKFNFTVQPKSVIRVNYKSLTLKQSNNGFIALLSNSMSSTETYELKVSVCQKGIISIEVKDLQETFNRFKVNYLA